MTTGHLDQVTLLDTCMAQLHLIPSLGNNFDTKRETDPVGGKQLDPFQKGCVGGCLGIERFQMLLEIVSIPQCLTLPMLHTCAARTASVPLPGAPPWGF